MSRMGKGPLWVLMLFTHHILTIFSYVLPVGPPASSLQRLTVAWRANNLMLSMKLEWRSVNLLKAAITGTTLCGRSSSSSISRINQGHREVGGQKKKGEQTASSFNAIRVKERAVRKTHDMKNAYCLVMSWVLLYTSPLPSRQRKSTVNLILVFLLLQDYARGMK